LTVNANEGKTAEDLVILAASVEYDVCQFCDIRPAEIFQVTGKYCLVCWQELTHPEV
jgi:hypothetical protein